jgi:hypothetical protein
MVNGHARGCSPARRHRRLVRVTPRSASRSSGLHALHPGHTLVGDVTWVMAYGYAWWPATTATAGGPDVCLQYCTELRFLPIGMCGWFGSIGIRKARTQ